MKFSQGTMIHEPATQTHSEAAVRAIAFYLPQFHPIAENDAWWGTGFTEWTNVTRARPSFAWHGQPHLPADLGFYDLRLAEVREQQAALARQYGIHGFCYYHYWFHGRRLLERPFGEVLNSGSPEFPFCLCWANEDWTRAWDGRDQRVLMPQEYSAEDDCQHIRWLCGALEDERYIRVDGKPLLLVYRATKLPQPQRTADLWRAEARRHGIGDIFLAAVHSFAAEHVPPGSLGFDAAVEFQPDWGRLGPPLFQTRLARTAQRAGLLNPNYGRNRVYEYRDVVGRMLSNPGPEYLRFPCVTPMWDNTARRQRGAVILKGSTPELYEHWLVETIRRLTPAGRDRGVVFINAWNEWAEGNHLEPCQRWGHAYLEATRRALAGSGAGGQHPQDKLAAARA